MEHVDVAVIGGGQSGLATAQALRQRGIGPVVLEASDRAAGSWPRYYDSLTLGGFNRSSQHLENPEVRDGTG